MRRPRLDLASVAVAAGATLVVFGVALLVASTVPIPYSATIMNGVFLNETFVLDGEPSTGARSVHVTITHDPVYGPAAVIELRKPDGRLQALGAVMLSAGVNLVIITLLLAGLRDSLREARRGHGTSTCKGEEVKQHGQQPGGARTRLNTGERSPRQ